MLKIKMEEEIKASKLRIGVPRCPPQSPATSPRPKFLLKPNNFLKKFQFSPHFRRFYCVFLIYFSVPLRVEIGKPVKDPIYQAPLDSTEAMESCPKENFADFKDRLVEENLYLITEAGEQGRVPILILSMKEGAQRRRPAIVFLHCSYKCKEWLRPLLEAYASRGYIAVTIDSRYHGERASNKTAYIDALVSAWRNGDTMPFIFDTVWDLIKLGDYLVQREDIDPARIGITGESLGGMHAWFAAAADIRYSVVVPIIGVQGFRWALDHNEWQARVNSIKTVFEGATEITEMVIVKHILVLALVICPPRTNIIKPHTKAF